MREVRLFFLLTCEICLCFKQIFLLQLAWKFAYRKQCCEIRPRRHHIWKCLYCRHVINAWVIDFQIMSHCLYSHASIVRWLYNCALMEYAIYWPLHFKNIHLWPSLVLTLVWCMGTSINEPMKFIHIRSMYIQERLETGGQSFAVMSSYSWSVLRNNLLQLLNNLSSAEMFSN